MAEVNYALLYGRVSTLGEKYVTDMLPEKFQDIRPVDSHGQI